MKIFGIILGLMYLFSFDLFGTSMTWEQMENVLMSLPEKIAQSQKSEDLRRELFHRSIYQEIHHYLSWKIQSPVLEIDDFVGAISAFHRAQSPDSKEFLVYHFLRRKDVTTAHLFQILNNFIKFNMDTKEQLYILNCIVDRTSMTLEELDQVVLEYVRLGYERKDLGNVFERMSQAVGITADHLKNIIDQCFQCECSPFEIEAIIDKMAEKDDLTIAQLENILLWYRILGVDQEKITNLNRRIEELKKPPKRLPPVILTPPKLDRELISESSSGDKTDTETDGSITRSRSSSGGRYRERRLSFGNLQELFRKAEL